MSPLGVEEFDSYIGYSYFTPSEFSITPRGCDDYRKIKAQEATPKEYYHFFAYLRCKKNQPPECPTMALSLPRRIRSASKKKKGTSSVPISLWVDGFNSFVSK